MHYRSDLEFLGLPLVEIRVGGTVDGVPRRGVARGWIAVGDIALGVLVSFGGVACGGIAVGGVTLGALSVGGLAVGGLAVGGGAIGAWAIGGAAFAIQAAVGGLAVAVHDAFGGVAVSLTGGATGGEFLRSHHALRPPTSRVPMLLFLLPLVVLGIAARWKGKRDPGER